MPAPLDPDPYLSRVTLPPQRAATPLWLTLASIAFGWVIAAGIAVLLWGLVGPLFVTDAPALAPVVAPSPPLSQTLPTGPDATTAAGMAAIALAVTTALAPTSTPPPPTATYALSTRTPPLLCGAWVPVGAVCTQPLLERTPTPYPSCPTVPGRECRWLGEWSTPRPAAMAQGAAR